MKLLKMNILTALVAVFLCLNVSAALPSGVIYKLDFETGRVQPNTGSGPCTAENDCGWYGAMLPPANSTTSYCPKTTDTYNENAGISAVSSECRFGDYCGRFRVYYQCDYRNLNGGDGTTKNNNGGRQKPRQGWSIPQNNPDWQIKEGTEYWVALSYKVPSNWITDPNSNFESLMQFFKNESRNNEANAVVLRVVGSNYVFNFANANSNSGESYTYPVVKGEWQDLLLNFRLCGSGCSNGFIKLYLNGNDTPVFTDTGDNTESQTHKLAINLYKHSWHCSGDTQFNYSACMQNPNSTNDTGQNGPRQVFFDELRLCDGSFTIGTIGACSPAWDESAPTAELEVTEINLGVPVPAEQTPVYYTALGGDISGVYRISATDQSGNTTDMPAVHSNATGGRFETNDFTGLQLNPVDWRFYYDNANILFSSEIDDPAVGTNWGSPLDATVTSATGEFGKQNAVTVTNVGTNFGYLNRIESASSGDEITVRMTLKAGTQNAVRIRVRNEASDTLIFSGPLGEMAFFATGFGSGHEITQQYQDLNGLWHIEFKFVTDSTGTHRFHYGPNVNTDGASIIVNSTTVWIDRSAATYEDFEFPAELPDASAPIFSESTISMPTLGNYIASYIVNDGAQGEGQYYYVDDTFETAPSVAQVKAGQGSDGIVATAAFSGTTTTPEITLSYSRNPEIKHCGYMVYTSVYGIDSLVTKTDECIEPVTAPDNPKTIAWADDYNGTDDNRIVYRGTLFTGTMDFCVGYDDFNRYTSASNAKTPLFVASDIAFTSGAATLVEADLDTGSINQLITGKYYAVECWRQDTSAITGITKANPAVITSTGHPYSSGDYVYFGGIGGMTELNGVELPATSINSNSFSVPIDSSSFTDYTSGGTAYGDIQTYNTRIQVIEQ
jgi:hypothetical protein